MDWEKALGEIIELVKSTAPKLWVIARRQVIGAAIRDAILMVVLSSAAYGLVRLVLYCNGRNEEHRERSRYGWDDDFMVMGIVFGALGSIAAACLAIALLVSSVMRFYNPDYYAIKVLLGLVR